MSLDLDDALSEAARVIGHELRNALKPPCHSPTSCTIAPACGKCFFNDTALESFLSDALEDYERGRNARKELAESLRSARYDIDQALRHL